MCYPVFLKFSNQRILIHTTHQCPLELEYYRMNLGKYWLILIHQFAKYMPLWKEDKSIFNLPLPFTFPRSRSSLPDKATQHILNNCNCSDLRSMISTLWPSFPSGVTEYKSNSFHITAFYIFKGSKTVIFQTQNMPLSNTEILNSFCQSTRTVFQVFTSQIGLLLMFFNLPMIFPKCRKQNIIYPEEHCPIEIIMQAISVL